ncbi:MAG: tRNA (adenosine(37)-N6)-dimethylallyltransferase MiaA [Candidatus Peribacteraceae bacterium]|nr:tRNA (adenosine(37)-N6)-dimethylallyltransferase MiaA [Candidatus Peribacteraceae bacterium]
MAAGNAPSHWQELVSSFLAGARRPLIVILGPTASGKTGLSLEVAKWIARKDDRMSPFDRAQGDMRSLRCAEIVNADSRQLYRGLDIGTAKITEEERQGIAHHLLDVLDPDEEAAAGWYQSQAEETITSIRKAGHVPLLVGGSMLYVSAVMDGLTLAPVPDPALRKRLLREYEQDAGETLYRRLTQIDPESAGKIHLRNKPHLIRAVEIYELLGGPKSKSVPTSELRSGKKDEQKMCTNNEHDLLILGIKLPQDVLDRRINERVRQMFADGWVAEVQSLLAAGYGADAPAMKSHGYREIIAFLTAGEPASLDALQDTIAAKTRKYARGQMKWWKHDPRIHWVGPS